MTSLFERIVCLECGHTMPPDPMAKACASCGSPWLDARYDLDTAAGLWPAALIERGRSLWRYSELLPLGEPDPEITLGEGGTSLTRLYSYERLFNHPHLFMKDERQGPTSSFKDRQAALSVTALRRAGIDECVLASTGNAGAAYAAYCARAGIRLWLFVTSQVPAEKMREAALYGAEVVKVSGTYDETKHVAAEFARRKGLYFDQGAKSIPGKESMKTLAFEIAEQLGMALGPDSSGRWRGPDWYIQAVSGGIGPLGVWKGFSELIQMGFIARMPRLGIVQAAGCAPMVAAFQAGEIKAAPVIPQTLIAVLATGDPGFSYTLLRQAVLSNGGVMIAAEDGRTFDSMRRLASKAGISVEPATAVAFAGLEQMLSDGTIRPDETVVVNGSGHTFTAESHILGDRYVLDLQLQGGHEQAERPSLTEGLDAAIQSLDEQVTTILVVDDNPKDRRLIRKLLQRCKNYRIHEAASGLEALQVIHDHRPDLIITDLTMPEMDGFTLLETLKRSQDTAGIKVIVASARNLSEQEDRLLHEYTEVIWSKGEADSRHLLEQVIAALGHRLPGTAAHKRKPGSRQASGQSGGITDSQTILIIEDNPQDMRLARRLLSRQNHIRIVEAANGRDGLKAVHQHRPDLILLDLMLPEMDGFTVLDALKHDRALRDIPVVVISAKALNPEERGQLRAQAASILEKGTLNRQEFLYVIEDALQ
ncbi:MAG: pyridoxal-phosphate dependent enzyme [Anaerolineae bacterium]|nr:pyridoxal-phosphate dependent enzyme [Anaerolineae bacterium]